MGKTIGMNHMCELWWSPSRQCQDDIAFVVSKFLHKQSIKEWHVFANNFGKYRKIASINVINMSIVETLNIILRSFSIMAYSNQKLNSTGKGTPMFVVFVIPQLVQDQAHSWKTQTLLAPVCEYGKASGFKTLIRTIFLYVHWDFIGITWQHIVPNSGSWGSSAIVGPLVKWLVSI